jgi:hypothetical protein
MFLGIGFLFIENGWAAFFGSRLLLLVHAFFGKLVEDAAAGQGHRVSMFYPFTEGKQYGVDVPVAIPKSGVAVP